MVAQKPVFRGQQGGRPFQQGQEDTEKRALPPNWWEGGDPGLAARQAKMAMLVRSTDPKVAAKPKS